MGRKYWAGVVACCAAIAFAAACVSDDNILTDSGASDVAVDNTVPSDGGDASACADASADPNNCGVCGHKCATGYTCSAGVCGNVVVEIGSGANHACATLANGEVWCWGANGVGQAGVGDASTTAVPTLIPRDVSANSFTSLGYSGGFDHLCALRGNGNVSCWGNGQFSELGNHAQSFDGNPVVFPAPLDPVHATLQGPPLVLDSLARGPTATHTCGVSDAGVVYCWGNDTAGESNVAKDAGGSCNNGGNSCVFFAAPALANAAKQVAVGNGFTCSLDASGTVRCWGGGIQGQLGNSHHGLCFNCPAPPYTVTLASAASFIAAGDGTTCAILASDGSVWCWGINETDELGYAPIGADGGPVDPCCSIDCTFSGGHPRCEDHPIQVGGITNAAALAMGAAHVCALAKDGSVWCWGANDKGQLGIGSSNTNPSPTPTKLTGVSNVTKLVSGANHTCALEKDGSMWCWGLNDKGQLGGGTSNSSSPVQVTTLPH